MAFSARTLKKQNNRFLSLQTINLKIFCFFSKSYETNKSVLQLINGSRVIKDETFRNLNLFSAFNKERLHSLRKRDIPPHNSALDITAILDRLLQLYDPRLRPNCDGIYIISND